MRAIPNGLLLKEWLAHLHKHLVLLLNNCNLVPQKVTKQWLGHMSRE
jgi:ribosome biogenesis GTPase A